MTVRNLDKMLKPRSVALIGATPREGSLGAVVLQRLTAGGFNGPIGLVNPKHQEIGGRPCVPSATALPEPPDLGVVVAPASVVPDVISDLAQAGARAAVVISAGVDEASGLRGRMLEAARPHLLRVLGPNCLGLVVPGVGLDASFSPVAARPGRIALLSQSGAIVTAMLDWAASREIGFSLVASLGDMADVDAGDMLDWLAADRETSAILLYLEQVTAAKKFMSAARSAARVKPVVAIKSGRSAEAAKAAASHTGALAGADDVYDAALRRAGVLRVQTLEELFEAAEALSRHRTLASDRLAIVTNGGGAGVLAADALADIGARLAELSGETMKRLDAALPAHWSHGNPVDVIGDAGPERYSAAIEAVLEDPGVDAVLAMHCPTGLADPAAAAGAVLEAAARQRGGRPKPLLACWLGGVSVEAATTRLEQAGVPTFSSPASAVHGFGHLVNHAKAQRALRRAPPSQEAEFGPARETAREIVARALAQERRMLTEPEAKSVLAAYGVPTVETIVAGSVEDAEAAATKLFGDGAEAVVAKILSPDISHKSDVGGVRLNLSGVEEATEAVRSMLRQVKERSPGARIDGVAMQPMIRRPQAIELILGFSEDPVFGPVMLFGAGGVSVEVVADRALELPPLDRVLAGDMIDRTRVARLLRGYRDRPAADIEAVALALTRLSQLAADFPEIRELDINPLLADAKGVVALDARIVIAPAEAVAPGGNPRFSLRPYPSAWEKTVASPSGPLLLRPIRPSDGEAYRRFFAQLSPEDVRFRFFSTLGSLNEEMVARFTQLDYARSMAFVARAADKPEILGVARLASDPEGEEAEYGVIVRSDRKGQGLGRVLMTHLLDYAAAEGLSRVVGTVMKSNHAMLGLCARLGFEIKPHPDDPTLDLVVRTVAKTS